MKYILLSVAACALLAGPAMAQIDVAPLGRDGPDVHVGRPVEPQRKDKRRDDSKERRNEGRDCRYEDQGGKRVQVCTDHHFQE